MTPDQYAAWREYRARRDAARVVTAREQAISPWVRRALAARLPAKDYTGAVTTDPTF